MKTARTKLVAGFSVLVILIVAISVQSLTVQRQLTDITAKMYRHPLTVTRASLSAQVGIIKMHRSMKDVALAKSPEAQQAAADHVNEYEAQVYDELAVVKERILGAEGARLSEKVNQLFADWKPIRDQVIQYMESGQREQAARVTKERGAEHVNELTSTMDAIVQYASSKADEFYMSADDTADHSFKVSVTLAGFSVIFGAVVAFLLNRSIIQRISLFRKTITQIQQDADLRQRVDIHSQDEIGQAASAFNAMLDTFESLLNKLRTSSDSLASAAEQISVVARQSNASADSQREQLEQMAAAMNEMSSTVSEVASNASHAAEVAKDTRTATSEGSSDVESNAEVISALAQEVESAALSIEDLKSESMNIGSVIDVIRAIAEQTNLLALNAAIEAARAGEQGRGFAVVADEVRSLAGRTQDSTTETQKMIEALQAGSQKAVAVMQENCERARQGAERIRETVAVLQKVSDSVDQMSDLNIQIASAAEEQAATAEQLNQNVVSINEEAEQAANGAQQSETASAELSRLANELQQQVQQFKLRDV